MAVAATFDAPKIMDVRLVAASLAPYSWSLPAPFQSQGLIHQVLQMPYAAKGCGCDGMKRPFVHLGHHEQTLAEHGRHQNHPAITMQQLNNAHGFGPFDAYLAHLGFDLPRMFADATEIKHASIDCVFPNVVSIVASSTRPYDFLRIFAADRMDLAAI